MTDEGQEGPRQSSMKIDATTLVNQIGMEQKRLTVFRGVEI
jgi:hypothetical protein